MSIKKSPDAEYLTEQEYESDIKEALSTVFDYLPEGEELTLEDAYTFVRDKGDRSDTFEALNELVGEDDIFSMLESGEQTDFVYWK